MNDFIQKWFEKKIPRGCRPKPIFLSGDGNCGKTSLACMGTFSYWCTSWNFNNYRNFFDDYDGNEDAKNNSSDNAWSYLKPWIGGQDVVSIYMCNLELGNETKKSTPIISHGLLGTGNG